MRVTGSRPGASTATKIRSAPGVRVPVTIASHSWSCTRISVARNTRVPDHRNPKATASLLVDRPTDDRQEGLLERNRSDRRRQSVPEGEVHDLVDFFGPRDHGQGVPFLDRVSEGPEQIALTSAVLDGNPERASDLPLRVVRGALEEDPPFVDDVEPLGERLGLVEVMGREQDGRSLAGEVPEDAPHRPPREGVEAD